jgi:putative transposase
MQSEYQELTNSQWLLIEPFFTKRMRKHDLRTILNAIFWLNRVGGQWRNLDSKYPKWQIVYYYFRVWTALGIFDQINDSFVEKYRTDTGRNPVSSVNTIDSQSVKLAPFMEEERGVDGGKKVNGRKRHILTDTQGLIRGVLVGAANEHDGKAGCRLLKLVAHKLANTKLIFADHAYGGLFRAEAKKMEIDLEIAAKPEGSKGFVPVKIRWVVERTFGWTNFFRRITKDYERKTINSAAMIIIAQLQILLNRFKRLAK